MTFTSMLHITHIVASAGDQCKRKMPQEVRQDKPGRAINPDAADGNKTIAAKLLGVSRPRLYKMMERHGVQD